MLCDKLIIVSNVHTTTTTKGCCFEAYDAGRRERVENLAFISAGLGVST
jgi:hypothetical protein